MKVLIMSIFLARAWSLLRLNASSQPRSQRLLCGAHNNLLHTHQYTAHTVKPHRIQNYENNIHHVPVRLKVRILSLTTHKVNVDKHEIITTYAQGFIILYNKSNTQFTP